MRIITKDTNEFLNILYGTDKEDYGMTRDDIKTILKEKSSSITKIYDYLDDTNMEGNEQYDLGDVSNLLQLFINHLEYEENYKVKDNSVTLYYDKVDKKLYSEEEIRKMYLKCECGDIETHLEEYVDKLLSIENQTDLLQGAINNDLDWVLHKLNTYWGYEIVKFKECE